MVKALPVVRAVAVPVAVLVAEPAEIAADLEPAAAAAPEEGPLNFQDLPQADRAAHLRRIEQEREAERAAPSEAERLSWRDRRAAELEAAKQQGPLNWYDLPQTDRVAHLRRIFGGDIPAVLRRGFTYRPAENFRHWHCETTNPSSN